MGNKVFPLMEYRMKHYPFMSNMIPDSGDEALLFKKRSSDNV